MYRRYRNIVKRTLTCVVASTACFMWQGVAGAAPVDDADATIRPDKIQAEFAGRSMYSGSTIYVNSANMHMDELYGHANGIINSIVDSCVEISGKKTYEVEGGVATVGSHIAFAQAVIDTSVSEINIKTDITLMDSVEIDRSISIRGNGNKLLLAPGMTSRHLLLKGRGVELTITDLQINGRKDHIGGGLAAGSGTYGSTITLKDCTFNDNYAGGKASALQQGGGAALITGNNAVGEGSGDIKLVVEGCTFNNNIASGANERLSGGAILMDAAASDLIISGCEFRQNISSKRGGAVAYRAHGEQRLDVSNSDFSGNISAEGGGIGLSAASAEAGPVFNVALTGNRFAGNTGDNGNTNVEERLGNGGGIFASAETQGKILLDIKSGNISGNTAYGYGGGIYLQSASSQGSIECNMDENLMMTDNAVDKLEGKGGGVATVAIGEGDTISLNMKSVSINGHEATYGGGVFVSGTSGAQNKITLTGDSSIGGNKAGYGGGVALYSGGTMHMEGGATISDNTAMHAGGGVHVFSDSAFTSSSGVLKGNQATSEEEAEKLGGAIYVHESASVDLSGLSMQGNSADNGGGIYSCGNTKLNNCNLSGNKANYGGGAYIDKTGNAEIISTIFSANNASAIFSGEDIVAGNGGALYTNDETYGNIKIENVKFYDNNAEAGGYILEDDTAPASVVLLSGNSNTSPFATSLNNFDINYTDGKRATLYTVKIEYYVNTLDSEPLGEISEWVMRGTPLKGALDKLFGEGWRNTLQPEGYPNGQEVPEINVDYVVESDTIIKILYTRDPQELSVALEAPPQAAISPDNPPHAAPELRVLILEFPKPTPQGRAVIGSYGYKGGPVDSEMVSNVLPPSDEVAMLVPAPRPSSEVGKSWAVINLALTMASVLLGIVMLIKMGMQANLERMDDMLHIYEAGKHSMIYRVLTILAAIASMLLFVITENTSLPMRYIDKWTPVMAGILIIQFMMIALVYLSMKEGRQKAQSEQDDKQLFRRRYGAV